MAGPGELVDVVGQELDRVVDRRAFELPTGGELTSPKRQLAYVSRRLGVADVAGRMGLKPRTVRNWQLGRTRPSKSSQAELQRLYRELRRPEVTRRNRGKVTLPDTEVQISGTITFSDTEEYRDNFGGRRGAQPVVKSRDWAKILPMWREYTRRRRPQALREELDYEIQEALRAATDPVAQFEGDDYEFTILG